MNETLQTTCPSCHAVFRVKPVQLDAHGGKVRCGKCAYVFNAFETLVTPIETFSLMAPPLDEDEIEQGATAIDLAPPKMPTYDIRALTISEPVSITFPIPTDDQIDREAEAINREIAASTHPDLIDELNEPYEIEKNPKSGLYITPELHDKLNDLQSQLSSQEKRSHWRGIAWGSSIAVLLALLFTQSIYALRNQLAAYYPETKPALTAFCQILQCKVELLADSDLIKLDSSELQAAPDKPGNVILIASLRNLAPYRQAYPALELTLTDSANQPLARRQFTPADYLPEKIKPESGMPGQDELPIKLTLELTGLEAVGYKLLVYYP